jgi:hypothetical protein
MMQHVDSLSELADLGLGDPVGAGKVIAATEALEELFKRSASAMKTLHSLNAELLLKFGVRKVETVETQGVMGAIQCKEAFFITFLFNCQIPSSFSYNFDFKRNIFL